MTDYVINCSVCDTEVMRNGWHSTAPCEHYTSDHPLVVCEHYMCRRCIQDLSEEEYSCTVCNLDLTPWIELMMQDEDFLHDDCDDSDSDYIDDNDSGAETEEVSEDEN